MTDRGRRRLDAGTADHLLAGDPRARSGFGQLADRLAAASTAALPGELAGEDAARAAFRAAIDVERVPQARRSSMTKAAVIGKFLTVKAAVVAATLVSLGGVALAASTGVLPNPLSPDSPADSTPASTHSTGDATPSPSLVGLCTAYVAGAGEAEEQVLTNPAFTALVNAAGGRDEVPTFCTALGVTRTPEPGTGGPTDRPTGRPSQLPSPSHPGGQPTSLPTPSHP